MRGIYLFKMAANNKILKPGYNCLTIEDAENSGVIIDAANYYRAFYNAAKGAKKTILISGWQFDSKVKIMREDGLKVVFIDFLKELCETNNDLRIYILAWDFSVIYLLSREWGQKKKFIEAHPRIAFHFDGRHALVASRHQKYVVIDSDVAFAGGMDICERRWDDRAHLAQNPLRKDADGAKYDPYHDVQTFLAGPAALKLARIFAARWAKVTKTEIDIRRPSGNISSAVIKPDFHIPSKKAAISRTEARSLREKRKPIKEIKRLYIDAILHAEKLIFIENQYFTSFAIYRALIRKMKSAPAALQIVIVLPKREQTAMERVYVGISQNRMLNSLIRVARRYRQRIGVYHPVATDGRVDFPVFVHSKVMTIDDTFLTIGSANTSNRSMGLDSELNVSWEAAGRDDNKFFGAIDIMRTSLLAEHAGYLAHPDEQSLRGMNNLVDRLNALSDLPGGRLQLHKSIRQAWFSGMLTLLKIDRLIIDPENAAIEDNLRGAMSAYRRSIPRRALDFITRKLGLSKGRNNRGPDK